MFKHFKFKQIKTEKVDQDLIISSKEFTLMFIDFKPASVNKVPDGGYNSGGFEY